jgi:hypothetical protein
MAYQNFIPTIWATAIERELERLCVFVEDCNRKYEGEVKDKGDSVRILGVGRPTIRELDRKNASGEIVGPEEVEDTSVTLNVNQIRYFNYMVGDIDKMQAKPDIMDALSEETSEGLANAMDKFIADMAKKDEISKLFTTAQKIVAENASSGEMNVLDVLDEAIQKLQENDINANTPVTITVSPRFFKLFKKAYIKLDTNNSEKIKNGKVAQYGNITVKMSNNVARTGTNGAEDNILIRTKRAIAFVNPKTHTEAYRPEKKFADAVKGYVLFDGKVVRPKEAININVKYA